MPATKWGESFSARVFRTFVLTLLVVACLVVVPLVLTQRRALEADLIERGRTLAGVLARGERAAVYAENRELLSDAAQGVLEKEYVLALTVLAKDMRPLLAEGRGGTGSAHARTVTARLREAAARLGPDGGYAVLEEPASIDVLAPVVIRVPRAGGAELYFEQKEADTPKELIGWVRVSLDRDALRRAVTAMLARVAFTILAFLALGSALIYLIARRTARPLVVLSEQVRAFGRGEPVRHVSAASRDEVGRLADAFNAMIAEIEQRERAQAGTEQRLREAQKLEAVGTLARGIAHDFNNILSTVKGAVHILEKRYTDQDFLLGYTAKIRAALGRAGELIAGLIAFSRTKEWRALPLDLDSVLLGLAPTLRDIVGEGVRIELELASRPLPLLGDPLGLHQVLINLAANARDAMPDGGVLRIATGSGAPADGSGAAGAAGRAAGTVWMTVADTGVGMAPATRERVFEPFFTTKEVGRGTGLGLSIVHGIIEQHGGRITVQSEAGRGTTFTVVLPLLDGGTAGEPGAP
jgi:signal transduction histidine kinase